MKSHIALCVAFMAFACWLQGAAAITFKVSYGNIQRSVTISPNSDEQAVREAIAAAVKLNPNTITLKGSVGSPSFSSSSLKDGAMYIISGPKPPPPPPTGLQGSVKLGTLQKVMMVMVATGRYRTLGMDAFFTARRRFGGDCITDYYFLTDDVEDLDPDLHPRKVAHHDWPMSALNKYRSILDVVEADMEQYDYVFVLDADVEFEEAVTLMDVAADLVAVQHPDYPRFSKGFCETPKDKQKLCSFPYERNSESAAYVPAEFDKLPVQDYANWYYLQSSFWGGKTKFVKPAIIAIAEAIQKDLDKDLSSTTSQDERFFNWYFWSQRENPDIVMRILSHSFAFPYSTKYYGKWMTECSRPILRHHYNKGPLHLPVEEAEMFSLSNISQCMDAYPRDGPYLGLHGCHHLGKAQTILWNEEKPYIYSPMKRGCLDATGLKHGDLIVFKDCDKSLGQQWDFSKDAAQFVSRATKLCLDVNMKESRKPKYIGLKTCSDSEFQKWNVKRRKATWA